ncbi:MAG TPA: serine protease [Polyangiaceae bacterium]|nr:serine protease [Polyangiaceae bacterium]
MSPTAQARRWQIVIIVGSIAACGADGPPPKSAARPVSSAEPKVAGSVATEPPARPGHLRRSDVIATLSSGFGPFLTRVQVEPVLVSGRFRGWKIVKFREGDPLARGAALMPGDVVTSVNGRPLERPEQALAAFQALALDKELRVSYERSGSPRELVMPIDEAAPSKP